MHGPLFAGRSSPSPKHSISKHPVFLAVVLHNAKWELSCIAGGPSRSESRNDVTANGYVDPPNKPPALELPVETASGSTSPSSLKYALELLTASSTTTCEDLGWVEILRIFEFGSAALWMPR